MTGVAVGDITREDGLPPSKVREDDQRLQRLVDSGVVRPGTVDARKVLDEEPLDLGTSILEALKAERAGRY